MANPPAKFAVTSEFDFAAVAYLPIRKRDRLSALHVDYGVAQVRRADANERELIAQCLVQEHVHLPLGLSRPPAKKYVLRSALPDGTGALEPVEFLVLRNTSNDTNLGFYLCYEGRRANWQEVDFASGNAVSRLAISVLRAGRIATLAYLLAVCGADRVSWRRRKGDPLATRYRNQKKDYAVTVRQFLSTLRRLEERASAQDMPMIATAS